MTDKIKKPKRKPKRLNTSQKGHWKADSLTVEDGIASAILLITNSDGKVVEKTIKGYNDNCKTLTDAVAVGGEQIIRGVLLAKGTHMGMYGTGPEQIVGIVANLRHNFDTYEAASKIPYVNAFVMVKRGEHTIGMPLHAFGDDALALKDMAVGDEIDVPVRQTHEKQPAKWVQILNAEGAGTFKPAVLEHTTRHS